MADTPKPRRIWRVLFALSLALNVAVVGVVVGFGMREGGQGMSPRGFEFAVGPIGRALEQEDRRAIGEALRSNPALRRGGRGLARESADALVAVLQTTPFDPDAFSVVIQDATARASLVQNAARDALVAQVSLMTDAERAALAERIISKRRKGR